MLHDFCGKQNCSCGEDTVAQRLLPSDAPNGLVPVKVRGDGNCLFRAVAVALKMGGTGAAGALHHDHMSLRAICSAEIAENSASYAEKLWESATQDAGACMSESRLSPQALVHSCLSNDAMSRLSSSPIKDDVCSLQTALECEAVHTQQDGSWSSLPQVAALATCTGTNIRLVYPEVNSLLRPFYNRTVEPLGSKAADTITILFSSAELPQSLTGMVKLNHFVPLIDVSCVTSTSASPLPIGDSGLRSTLPVEGRSQLKAEKQRSIKSFFQSKPTPVKRKGSPQPETPQPRKYESPTSSSHHRSSGFDAEWRESFPWIEAVHGDPCADELSKFPSAPVVGMLCRLCRKHTRRPAKVAAGRAVWVDLPCKSFRKDALVAHANGKSHKDATLMETQLTTGSSVMTKVQAIERNAIIGKFKCLYWLCKEEIAHTTKFEPLLHLVSDLGVEYISAAQKGRNAQYTSRDFLQDAVDSLATTIKTKIFGDLKKSSHFSLMIDETTDVAVLKELIVYAKYLNCDHRPTTSFIGITALSNGQAVTIHDALKSLYEEKEGLDFQTRLVGFGSDGASVMTGQHNGVAARLRGTAPHLISHHCVAHRLALAASQAANNVPYIDEFKDVLGQLFRFFDNSPVRMANFKEVQEVLGDPQIRLTQAKDVRWLSNNAAVTALRKCFPSVIRSLEMESTQRRDAQALGLLTFCRKFKFVATLLLLSDTLPPLAKLSRAFQRPNISFGDVQILIDGTMAAINALKIKRGTHLSTLSEKLLELEDVGVEQPRSQQLTSFAENVEAKYLANLIANLESRFPCSAIIAAFEVFAGPSDDGYPAGYGEDDIGLLVNQFCPTIVHRADTGSEWRAWLEASRCDNHRIKNKGAHEVMHLLASTPALRLLYPNLAALASTAMVLPMSTVDCERGFSALGRIKTKLRNRLVEGSLNNLMFMAVEGPDLVDFDFECAVDVWAAKKQRRLNVLQSSSS